MCSKRSTAKLAKIHDPGAYYNVQQSGIPSQ
jgi:hypothetical protein